MVRGNWSRLILPVLLIVLLLASVVILVRDTNTGGSASAFSPFESIRIYEGFGRGGHGRASFVGGEVLVKFGRRASEREIVGLRAAHGCEEAYVSPFSGVRRWKVPPSKTVAEWANFLDRHPLVEYAEPNFLRYALWYPDDSLYGYQWHFDDEHTNNVGGADSNPYGGVNGGGIGMEDAWQITGGSSNVVVAIIDTGVAYEDYTIPSHEKLTVKGGVKDYHKAPDLGGTSFWVNVDEVAGNGIDDDGNGFVDDVNGWDFVNNDAHPNDNNGHGTHVTGTIAQTTDNGLGVAGVAFNTTIMPIKVLDYSGAGDDTSVANGIYYAMENGADIISMSLGGPDYSITLEYAVADAYGNGTIVMAASGNGGEDGVGDDSCDYPAAYDSYVIAVGATRYDETRSSYSNYGSSLDLVAPGGDVYVDQNGDGYADGVLQQTFKPYQSLTDKADTTDWSYYFFDGTSMATPHASGVAALMLSVDPSLSPDEIRSVLESTAEDLGAAGRDDYFGYGLIDARAALESVAPPVHLLLSVDPFGGGYVGGEELSFGVRLFNEDSPAFNSTLSLTVTGPGGYYLYDFQNIVVATDAVEEFFFVWVVPEVAGTYVVEVGLVPPQLTTYDAAWLDVS